MEPVVAPFVVEAGFAGPDSLDDAPPFFALRVPSVVLFLGDAEHLEFVLVPATDYIHAEASLPDVVRRGHLLGRHERMMQGDVDRAEDPEVTGGREQATRPGNRLEAGPVGVGVAAIAFPPRDGHHALESEVVCHLRQLEVILPASLPALREHGVGSPARAIGAEESESKTVARHDREDTTMGQKKVARLSRGLLGSSSRWWWRARPSWPRRSANPSGSACSTP